MLKTDIGGRIILSAFFIYGISSSALQITIVPSPPAYGATMSAGLIVLLSLKEVLSASGLWDKALHTSLNIAILPLLYCFISIVLFKSITVVVLLANLFLKITHLIRFF